MVIVSKFISLILPEYLCNIIKRCQYFIAMGWGLLHAMYPSIFFAVNRPWVIGGPHDNLSLFMDFSELQVLSTFL